MVSQYSTQQGSSRIGDWLLASRPWSFTAAVIPLALGAALAGSQTGFRPGLCVLTLVAGVLMQAAVNYLNTYGDFVSGVDTPESVTGSCAQLVRREMNPRTMRNVGLFTLGVAVLMGILPVMAGGLPVLCCGIAGVLGVAFYTTFLPYKYRAMGPPFVFILMGPLMVVPAWYVQGAVGVWIPLLASLPVGCLVVAIMHGNDIRDIEHDHEVGIMTPAILLGRGGAILLFKGFYKGAYLCLGMLVVCKVLGYFALLPFVLLPLVYRMLHGLGVNSERLRLEQLEGSAAKVHFLFGILLVLGIVISRYVEF